MNRETFARQPVAGLPGELGWMRDPGEPPGVGGQFRVVAPQAVGKAVADLCLEIGCAKRDIPASGRT